MITLLTFNILSVFLFFMMNSQGHSMQILLLSDIHGNYPALRAIDSYFAGSHFDHIVNCGDSLVYAPFGNEVIDWLIEKKVLSILGNTDKKVIKLLRGKPFAKPAKADKRIMYTHTADQLSKQSSNYMLSLDISAELPLVEQPDAPPLPGQLLGIFHGSPAKPHEFLFDTSPRSRFEELAAQYPYRVIATGHSHTPYHFLVGATHFINPGSAGRMFDGNPAACCAVLSVADDRITVRHHRVEYDITAVIQELERQGLPHIYQTMFMLAKKLN